MGRRRKGGFGIEPCETGWKLEEYRVELPFGLGRPVAFVVLEKAAAVPGLLFESKKRKGKNNEEKEKNGKWNDGSVGSWNAAGWNDLCGGDRVVGGDPS